MTNDTEKKRCGKEMHDGSICGVVLDCHLHDWRQKDLIRETITKALEEMAGEANELQAKLVDRDTNLGMNESYRMALDEIRDIISRKKKEYADK